MHFWSHIGANQYHWSQENPFKYKLINLIKEFQNIISNVNGNLKQFAALQLLSQFSHCSITKTRHSLSNQLMKFHGNSNDQEVLLIEVPTFGKKKYD